MFSLWQYCKDGLTKHNQACVMHWWSSDVFFVTVFMLPKRRFWKAEQTFQRSFSTHFSTFRRPNSVLTPLKSVSKMTSEMFVLLPKSSFGKDNIARMGLQNTTNMRYALMIVWCFLCNNIARRITRCRPSRRPLCCSCCSILMGWFWHLGTSSLAAGRQIAADGLTKHYKHAWCIDDRLMFSL